MNKEDQLKYIASVVRALVTSRKPPVDVKLVLKDYTDVEGGTMPFRQLGYNTPVELLQQTGEFSFRSFNGMICITANYSAKTEHIASMVRTQKKGKTSSLKPQPTKRPLYTYNNNINNNNYNRSSNNNNAKSNKQSLVACANSYNNQGYNYSKQVNNNNTNSGNSNFNTNNNTKNNKTSSNSSVSSNNNNISWRITVNKNNTNNAGNKNIETVDGEERKRDEKATEEFLKLKKQREEELKQKEKQLIEREKALEKIAMQQQQEEQRLRELKTERMEQERLAKEFKLNNNNNNTSRQNKQQQQQQQPETQVNNNSYDLREKLNAKRNQQQQQHNSVSQYQKKDNMQETSQMLRAQQQQQQRQFPEVSDMQKQKTAKPMRPILGQANTLPTPPSIQTKKHNNQRSILPSPPQTPASAKEAAKPFLSNGRTAISVQNRLKIQVANNLAMNSNVALTPPKTPEQTIAGSVAGNIITPPTAVTGRRFNLNHMKPPQHFKTPFYKFSAELDPISSLEQYCRTRGYSEPEYKFFDTKKMYHCRVKINDQIFSSYPIELPDRQAAKLRTAEIAVEKLRELESRNYLPTCHLNDQELIQQLYEKLKLHPNGVISKNMSQWFENTFGQLLPDRWWELVQSSDKFKLEESLTNFVIIYANTEQENALQNVCSPPRTPSTPYMTLNSPIMPPIKLPWDDENGWSLLITHCSSTVEVWARLFGSDYSDFFMQLTRDLEDFMKTRKQRPTNVQQYQFYLVRVSDCWHRVRVEELDLKHGKATCFFVDFGDVDTLSTEVLFVCPPQFLQLSPQAICFSLYGLEDFADNPHALNALDTVMSLQSVVAQICTKESEFQTNGGCAQGRSPLPGGGTTRRALIQAVFFDTSPANDDINLNQLLLQQICDNMPPPQLKLDFKNNPVLVSYVSDNGDLFLLIPNDDWKYVQRLIAFIVDSKFKREQHQVTNSDLNRDNMFLICDNTSSPSGETQWYRGMLTEKSHSLSDEAFDMYYVDDGRMRSTHISKIFRLESLSMALSKFPPQAIRVRLHDIPPVTMNTIARMRGLLPPLCDALVKVIDVTTDDLPAVTVFTRGSTGAYCAVNDTLRIEYEMENSNATGAAIINGGNDSSPKIQQTFIRSDSHSSTKSVSSTSMSELMRNLQQMSPNNKVNIVPNSPQKLNGADLLLPALKEFEAIPALEAYFEVRVSYSANPTFFVVQPYKEYPQLSRMMRQLQDYCDSCTEFVPPDSIVIGQAYATKNATDSFYHRVVVLQNFGETVRVKYADFGDDAAVRSTQLKPLPGHLRQLPKMAVHAKLYGIKCINSEWSKDDCIRFRELTLGKKFITIVHNVCYTETDAQKVALLTLELIDTSTTQDIRIHELLIQEKRALSENDSSGFNA